MQYCWVHQGYLYIPHKLDDYSTFKAGFLILHWHLGLGNPLLRGHHCEMGSSISSLYPLKASNTPPPAIKNVSRHCQMPPEGKTAKLRTTALKGESKAYSLPFLKIQPYVKFAKKNLLVLFVYQLSKQKKKCYLPRFEQTPRQILPKGMELCTILERKSRVGTHKASWAQNIPLSSIYRFWVSGIFISSLQQPRKENLLKKTCKISFINRNAAKGLKVFLIALHLQIQPQNEKDLVSF